MISSGTLIFSIFHVSPHLEKPQNDDAATVTCATCEARCCRLEVMLMEEDDIPVELTEVDAWGGTVMARLDDGWCAALDRDTKLCTIYERRPAICRDFELGGSDCVAERSNTYPLLLKRERSCQ